MAYSTKLDLQRIVQSSDVTALSQKNESNITNAIAEADNLIDLQLGGIYTIPLNPIDEVITRISAMLAIYFLFQTKLNLTQYGNEGAYRIFYKDAMELLKQIRTQQIGLSSALIDDAVEPTIVLTSTSTRKFSDTILAKF